jgi:hypothetical protein
VKDRQPISDVFDSNIVSDHIALESGGEGFAKFGRGVDPKAIGPGGNKDMGVNLTFRTEHAPFDCG